jgi:shikimate dehydrogenase
MKTYGLVGYPLTQSFSQKYFTQRFENEKIDAQYLNFSIESIGEFPEILDDNESLEGLNVTIPYKEKVIPFINELDSIAQKVGAVNLIKIGERKSKPYLIGSNSDVYGFKQSLKPFLKPHHTNALILGTGGASKAVRYVLKELGISYKLVSRKPKTDWLTYSDITPQLLKDSPLIINTTPLGMFPNIDGCPTLPFEAINGNHLVFDMVYNPLQTILLKKSADAGANTLNGYQMLILQAEKSWEYWSK